MKFLLKLLVIACLVLTSQSQNTTSSSTGSSSTDGSTVISPTPTTTKAQSQCEACRDYGECSRAYVNTEGKYCGKWIDSNGDDRACCCPANAICRVSNYKCMCSNPSANNRSYSRNNSMGYGFLFFALLIGVCICFTIRSKRRRSAHMYSEQGAPGYAVQPGYGPGYGPDYGGRFGGGGFGGGGFGRRGPGVGAGLAAGGLGGLLLGSAIADAGDHGFGGGFGGGDFGGGGGDFGGDF